VNAEMMMIIYFFLLCTFKRFLDAIFLYSQFLLHRCSIVASVDAIFFFFFFLHSSYVSLEKHLTGEAKREKSLILLSCHLDFTIEKNKNEDSRVIGMKRRNFERRREISEQNFFDIEKW
jgi:hypothetical protein